MPKSAGPGSFLTNVAAAHRRVVQTRKLLGLGERGIETPQRPLPPQQSPADTRPPQQAPAPETNVPPERMEPLLQRTAAMLAQAKAGGRATTLPPEEPLFRPVNNQQRPIGEALNEVMANTVTPEIAFFRLAGRAGSPRELAIFNTRIALEGQLGRPPTQQELKMAISGPPASPSRPGAMELGG